MGTSAAAPAPRIFVSYNRQDAAFTRRLVQTLEALDVVVWVDWEGARDGDFLKRINQGLVRCDWLVLVETPNSLKSDPVEMEVNAALNRALYGQMRGVVRLVASPRDPRSVPPTWATLQYYDATTDYDGAVAAMLDAIRAGDARQARRPGAEHPGGSSLVAPAIPTPTVAPATPGARLINRMATATAESDWHAVVDLADLLLAEFPSEASTDFYRMQGRALLELGRPGEAAQALRKAYERDTMDIPTMRAAARAALQANDLAGAEPLLKRAVTLAEGADERLDILREYAPTLQALGKQDEALSRVDQALRLRPDDPSWLALRRDVLSELGRNVDALAVARTLTARPGATSADWLAQARLQRLSGALDEAAKTLQTPEVLASNTPGLEGERDLLLAALLVRRERERQANQWAEALRTVVVELGLSPTDPTRRIVYADLLHRVGRDGEARDAVGALLDGRYGNVTAPAEALALGRLCADLGLVSAAWDTLNHARLLDTTHAGDISTEALTLATHLAGLPGAPVHIRMGAARLLVTAKLPRDAWNLLVAPATTDAERAQLHQLRAELFPPPDAPVRLTSLGFRGVNVAGAQAILPPLVSVAAGPFLMGSDKAKDREAYDNELPQHRVESPAFQIGKYPVTVAEYALAVRAGAVREPPSSGNVTWQIQLQRIDHPVVCVSWQDAMAYIAWLREVAGQHSWRLPSEAEWEKAARWDAAHGASRIYPWGDSFDKNRCNTSESGIGATTPVGSYPANDRQRSGASPCGAEDMAGNVWEWTSSVFKPYPYTSTDGREDDKSTENRTLRGGSWGNVARLARVACRLDYRRDDLVNGIGFRLALSPSAGSL